MELNTSYCFLIADDHSIVRNGLALLIKGMFEDVVLYQAGTFYEIEALVKEAKIDLLIVDISFPEGKIIKLLSKFKAIQPKMKILVFSTFDEEIFAMPCINEGADGYLSKLSSPEEIQEALEIMINEGKYTSAALKDKIITSFMLNSYSNPFDRLSKREFEIATLLAKGLGNLEISNKLNLKATTISTYKIRVFGKLGVTNLPELLEKLSLYNDKY